MKLIPTDEVERGDTVKEADKDESISAGDSKEGETDPGIQQEEGEIVESYLMLHEIMVNITVTE